MTAMDATKAKQKKPATSNRSQLISIAIVDTSNLDHIICRSSLDEKGTIRKKMTRRILYLT